MISSRAMAGALMSMRPNPASSGIGVKLSLFCAEAARAHPAAINNAKDHRLSTISPITRLDAQMATGCAHNP
jgi:hypothetical protein